MKNYPNQASSFDRIRATLQLIAKLRTDGSDVTRDEVLGYACASAGIYTFRGLDPAVASQDDISARILLEREKPASSQGVRTYARELRRTLIDLGWIDETGDLTTEGDHLLATPRDSIEEQALLVEGLLNIEAYDAERIHYHHPIHTMLRLLAIKPTLHRGGLELALEPKDDSAFEFERVASLYGLQREARISQLGITDYQRANAVKIFPTLAVTAGLVVEDDDGMFSLSQDGWAVIAQTTEFDPASPNHAKKVIGKRRGRRTTLGKLVSSKTIAARRSSKPPRTLTEAEQKRAAAKLRERTISHQALVKRTAVHIGDEMGQMFEDEFSYDLLWVPPDESSDLVLFEMKSIESNTDSYARVRDAVGQLYYYTYFFVEPTWRGRGVSRAVVVNSAVPSSLVKYLQRVEIGGILLENDDDPHALNALGDTILGQLP